MRTIIPKDAVLVPERAVLAFKGHIFDTYQFEQEMFDGSFQTFEMLKRHDSVEILVIENNKLLIQKQEQPHLGHFLSLPGGMHDHSEETELEAAQRELREETGYVCASWKLVRVAQSYRKIESFIYTFLATDVTERLPMKLDVGEKIENVWCTLSEVHAYVAHEGLRSSADTLFEDMQEAGELLNLPKYKG